MGYKLLGGLRLLLGWTFLWAFFDKLFGLGFATVTENAWLAGGSPTSGFLQFASQGPLANFYQSLAGQVAVDWLFMLGLLFVGLFLMLGIMVKLSSWIGALMLFLMYTAAFMPPENNPFWDTHLTQALILIALPFFSAGDYFGFGKWWSRQALVIKYPVLK